MFSKSSLLATGILSAQAYNLQEFIPESLGDYLPVNVEFNSTHLQPEHILKYISHETNKVIEKGHHEIKKMTKDMDYFDINDLKPESWKEYDEVDKTDPDFSKTFE